MKVIKNKSVANASTCIIKLKKEDVADRADELFHHYLEGGIIVIEKFRPTGVSYSALKHFSQSACQYSWRNRAIKKMHTTKFLKMPGISEDLRKEVLNSERSIGKSVYSIFSHLLSTIGLNNPKVKFTSIWRCLPVINENYHVDVYEETPLRAYWNLDNSPRVWGFGHSALDVLRMFEDDSGLKMILNHTGNFKEGFQRELNLKLTQLADSLEFHIAEFDPYDLWIADGTKGFHKIIYGKNMLSQNLTLSSGCSQKLDSALSYRKWISSGLM